MRNLTIKNAKVIAHSTTEEELGNKKIKTAKCIIISDGVEKMIVSEHTTTESDPEGTITIEIK